jgi:hypothetical protein
MMVFSVPPGYRRQKPPGRPKLDRCIVVADEGKEPNRPRDPDFQHARLAYSPTALRVYSAVVSAYPAMTRAT